MLVNVYRTGRFCFLALLVFGATTATGEATLSPELRERAVGVLRSALDTEAQWVKVHAAEALLELGYTEGVREAFEAELAEHGEEPQYRIGIWRVLARASHTDDERNSWIAKIRDAFVDTKGPDRLHAVETLAKLGYTPAPNEIPFFEFAALGADSFSAYARWVLAQADEPGGDQRLAALLNSSDPGGQSSAAYALRNLRQVSPATASVLAEAAAKEPPESKARVYLSSAAYAHATEDARKTDAGAMLERYAAKGSIGQKREATAAWAEMGSPEDVPRLLSMLDAPEVDVQIGAALALLRIGRRMSHRMGLLDWCVIALYAMGMIAVGWYYGRRTKTTEDYLLGGRSMRPLAVGLSMFASLLSTLSYLAIPGEMIKHGPMIAGQYLVYPLTFVVIGWLIIPYIMRMRITSAYEILEQRLGLSVRMLGSCFFLSLRLLWMAVIIYATSDKVLVPLLGWDAAATPLVCAVLGLITIIYTSMGGLRAVVMTDVVQTAILFGGAGLTLALITIRMGGVTAWWPNAWAPNWDPLRIVYDPGARITIMGAMTASFIWYVCTAGSDQVAIQRYLATPNAKAARRVLATSLISDVCVGCFLAILGLALFSYFTSNPHLLPDRSQVYTNSDTLFPRFIVMGLPAGITGLVVAGLLAAAMSSLSSGLNSSCSVISVDFVGRFRKAKATDSEDKNLVRTKAISVGVGVLVIFLSVGVSEVGGNLLEIAYKVVNLLTAPLFILFFVALFVPWGTSFGAIAAGLGSAVMAVGVGYFQWFGLSFLWIMPLALLTGVGIGLVASLLPIGRRRKAAGGDG